MNAFEDEHGGGAMVPYRTPDAASQAIAAWEGGNEAMRTSIELSTAAGKTKLFTMLATAQLNGSSIAGKTLAVTDWLVTFTEGFESDDGEVRSGLRLALLCDDGTTFHTWSATCLRDWGMVLKMFGTGPWMPPLKISFSSKPCKKNPGSYVYIAGVVQDAKPAGRKQ